MAKNVLIGIGGTGSRVIESVVHLCAAGYGPDKLHIFMIDPDAGNGNLTRTKTLIRTYSKLRETYNRTSGNDCFKTEIIIPPNDEPYIWSIFEDNAYTLKRFINYDNIRQSSPDLAYLADVLFTEKELVTNLERGFRGHPSIGAVVMADPPMNDYPFRLLWENIEGLGTNELKVFIVGSIFGGTGAAGFPTLGSRQLIKFNEEKQAALADGKSKVLLGGALVLPYFTFSLPDDTAAGQEKMFVTPNDFPVATKAALQYYDTKELGFDQYYFIGDSLAQRVGEFHTGGEGQQNNPHYVEMAGALASFDFFNQPPVGDKIPEKKYFITRRDTKQINWAQLPLTRDSDRLPEERRKFKKMLSDFSVFAYSYLTYGVPNLEKSHKDLVGEKVVWYREAFEKRFEEDNARLNPRHPDNKEIYERIEDYFKQFLYWIASMDDGENGHVELINKHILFNGALAPGGKNELIKPDQYPSNIGRIINSPSNKKDFNRFLGILNEASEDKRIKEERTITAGSRFLNLFYLAASDFNNENLTLH